MRISVEVIKRAGVFILFLSASIALGYIFTYLNRNFFHYSSEKSGLSKFSKKELFFMAVFLAPIIETFVFIWLPWDLLKRIKVSNIILLIIVPSILFALSHLYNPVYFWMAFKQGILMNIYFHSLIKNLWVALGLVTLLHACYNLYGFIFVI